MKKERNSSIEMLRILAMLGIVIMHTNGAVMSMVQELDLLGHRLKMASLMPEFRFLF